jgi:hypothetical protein
MPVRRLSTGDTTRVTDGGTVRLELPWGGWLSPSPKSEGDKERDERSPSSTATSTALTPE